MCVCVRGQACEFQRFPIRTSSVRFTSRIVLRASSTNTPYMYSRFLSYCCLPPTQVPTGRKLLNFHKYAKSVEFISQNAHCNLCAPHWHPCFWCLGEVRLIDFVESTICGLHFRALFPLLLPLIHHRQGVMQDNKNQQQPVKGCDTKSPSFAT